MTFKTCTRNTEWSCRTIYEVMLTSDEHTLLSHRVNVHSNMTSFKRFGSKPVVKYAYIGISADRQRHNLFWLLYKNKYRICAIRI